MVDRIIEPMAETDRMPFGKHKGMPLRDVPLRYLNFIRDQEWIKTWPRLLLYIQKRDLRKNERR